MQKVNLQRVKNLLDGVSEFGRNEPGKGITRLAYTPEDFAAQNWLLEQVKDLKLTVTQDAVGNIFLRRPGKNNALPPVATGSHLDTVIQAGAYDGVVGVVGALEALYMLQDEALTAPVEVIIFRAEESSRFGFATMGSKLMTGSATVEKLASATKKNDISFTEALKKAGYDPSKAAEAIKAKGCYKCFLEMHIEQGKVLDETGEQLGIVHNIAAPTRFKIIIDGMADHSGATPMGFRKDALVAAAHLILAVEKAATEEAAHGTVGTVGVVDVEPSSINVVPGKVTLWVDIRGVEEDSIKRTLQKISKAMQQVSDHNKVKITQQLLTADTPVALSSELAAEFDQLCRTKKLKYRHMNSGAGHDAMHMAKLVPTSMLFIPCKDGISHNPAESAEIPDICTAVEILAAMVKQQANK